MRSAQTARAATCVHIYQVYTRTHTKEMRCIHAMVVLVRMIYVCIRKKVSLVTPLDTCCDTGVLCTCNRQNISQLSSIFVSKERNSRKSGRTLLQCIWIYTKFHKNISLHRSPTCSEHHMCDGCECNIANETPHATSLTHHALYYIIQ